MFFSFVIFFYVWFQLRKFYTNFTQIVFNRNLLSHRAAQSHWRINTFSGIFLLKNWLFRGENNSQNRWHPTTKKLVHIPQPKESLDACCIVPINNDPLDGPQLIKRASPQPLGVVVKLSRDAENKFLARVNTLTASCSVYTKLDTVWRSFYRDGCG